CLSDDTSLSARLF
nr:immunoglobulin light chain junction region [Macaca mulatta]